MNTFVSSGAMLNGKMWLDPGGGWVMADFTSLTDFIPGNLHRFVQRSFYVVVIFKTPDESEIRKPVIWHSTSDSQRCPFLAFTIKLKQMKETSCKVASGNFRLQTGSDFDEARLTSRQTVEMWDVNRSHTHAVMLMSAAE